MRTHPGQADAGWLSAQAKKGAGFKMAVRFVCVCGCVCVGVSVHLTEQLELSDRAMIVDGLV